MTQSLRTLLVQLADTKSRLPVRQLHLLSDMPPAAVAAFEEAWPGIDLYRRREIMRHLAEICQSDFSVDFGPVALIGIRDEDEQVRLAALDTFWDAEAPELIAPLLGLLNHDAAVAVQASAALALGQFVMMGELGELPTAVFEDLTDDLLAVLRDSERALLVRCRALEALSAAGRNEVPELIRDAYGSGEETLRISAVAAMGRTADPRWEPIVIAELASVNPSMRYHATRAAGMIALEAALPDLIDLLEDPDPEVVAASIWALGEIGGDEARWALESLLDDDEIGDLVQDALEAMDLMTGASSFDPYSTGT
jgi:HEAT repeat protein